MSSFQEIHVRIADWLLERRKAEAEAGDGAVLFDCGDHVDNRVGFTCFRPLHSPFEENKIRARAFGDAKGMVLDDRKNMPIALALIEAMLEAVVERGAVIDSQNIEKALDGWSPKARVSDAPRLGKKSKAAKVAGKEMWTLYNELLDAGMSRCIELENPNGRLIDNLDLTLDHHAVSWWLNLGIHNGLFRDVVRQSGGGIVYYAREGEDERVVGCGSSFAYAILSAMTERAA